MNTATFCIPVPPLKFKIGFGFLGDMAKEAQAHQAEAFLAGQGGGAGVFGQGLVEGGEGAGAGGMATGLGFHRLFKRR
jgi:hypothetical protein